MTHEVNKPVLCYCPACREKSLEVKITLSGVSFSPEFGAVHWFEGEGCCSLCGWSGDYGDSSA